MRSLAALFLLLLLGASGVAWGSPSRELVRARGEFERGEYQHVVDSLDPSQVTDPKEQEEAHYLLGVSSFYLGRKAEARREFTALLFINPTRNLDPVTESPDVYEFFVTLKTELRDKLDELRRQKEREEALKNRPSREVVIERIVHERSPIVNFVPFGVPQFANQERKKGVFFLAGQTAFGGAYVSLLAWQALKYGIPSRVPAEDVGTVKTLQVLEIGTGSVFLILYVWSVIDGFANQHPKVEEHRTERPYTPAPASRPATGVQIVPLLAPNTVGVGASWRF